MEWVDGLFVVVSLLVVCWCFFDGEVYEFDWSCYCVVDVEDGV